MSLSLIELTLVEFDFKFFVFFFLALNTFQKIPTERCHSKTWQINQILRFVNLCRHSEVRSVGQFVYEPF